jgi:hypothetical protein
MNNKINFQKFRDFRYSLLNEDFKKYDSSDGLRGILADLKTLLSDDENIKKLDAHFIKITNKNQELSLLDEATTLLQQLNQIVNEEK